MTDDLRREIEELIEARPDWDDRGVPGCYDDQCNQYDGKRCRLTGCRPSSLCEPAVIEMAALLNRRTHA